MQTLYRLLFSALLFARIASAKASHHSLVLEIPTAYDAAGMRVVKREGASTTLYLAPDPEVRDGVATTCVKAGSSAIARVEEPAYATMFFPDVAPIGDAGKAGAKADGVITAGDAWLVHASKSGLVDLPPPDAARAKTADVDKMLASAARRILGADATQTTYVAYNHLGSPSLEPNERGEVVARRWHGPYGEVRGATGTWNETRGFTGKERDDATGLADHGARYLDTRLGRWTAPDPLAVRELGAADADVYGYVGGRVTSEHDPDGQFGHIAFGAAVGAFVGGAVEGARQFQSGHFDARALVTSIAGGAAVGGVAAATGGASLATQATVGAFSSAYVGSVSRAALGQKVTASTVAMDASMGAAAPAVGKIVSAAASSATRGFRGAVESHRQAVASRFYRENAPWLDTEAKRLSHLNGIDVSKSVSVVRFRAGESFSQWQLPEATQGSYYAQLGDGPAGLGIKTAGRIRADYVATEETHALRSTANTVTVDWDGPVEVAEGGRTQFFAPDRTSFKKVSGE